MNGDTLSFLLDPANWALGDVDGFPHRILQHLGYSALALAIAFAIAFPAGLVIGHSGRGSFAVISLGNAGRALPTLGVVMLALAAVGIGLLPVTIALVVLAVPPILTSTFAGVRAVPAEAVDAARGVGMTPRQVLLGVELPNALPIILGGFRNATLQVISTATIAAYVGLGGLGRYLFDGLALLDYPRVVGGAVVLAVLAVAVDLALGGVQRILVSPGVDGRAGRGPRQPARRRSRRSDSLPTRTPRERAPAHVPSLTERHTA
ncbi:ABC transporter permease [Nocardioides sp. GY 10113]|uniref:ABC transporter permease n=1 Tax=Nocardioides sp. GY 10113 TaxID=2569761 RepID=UPI0010A897BB|nr:ABC transporter permease [Nocardioides sp. GY 10113]TIC80671.1 ABC transporter permease [Nocardioides sp. GY 10113]